MEQFAGLHFIKKRVEKKVENLTAYTTAIDTNTLIYLLSGFLAGFLAGQVVSELFLCTALGFTFGVLVATVAKGLNLKK